MWAASCAEQEVVAFDRDWLFTAMALVGDIPFAHLVVRLHHRPRTTTYAGSVVRFAARVLQMIGLAAHAKEGQEGPLGWRFCTICSKARLRTERCWSDRACSGSARTRPFESSSATSHPE